MPRDVREIVTGRSGVITSFSSAAPTNFGHLLKPDVAAPGGQILSSTSPESAGNGTPFAVFDGTSMSAPHVSGAAALLLQAHPTWTPAQMRSALVSTAGPAWGDTARTQEAPVTLQGGGLVDVVRADEPLIFTNPVSLSFGDLNVNRGGVSAGLVSTIADAGGGAGEWAVFLRPQAATVGASITADPAVTIAPGGEDSLKLVVRVAANAAAGDNFGFVALTRGNETRKIPYYFAVTRPGLESKPASPLRAVQQGDTSDGLSHTNMYRFPSWPFGPPPDYGSGLPMNEDGAEDLYTTLLDEPAVNLGASVWFNSANAFNHPWLLGSPDENDVQGQGGIPVNVNNYTLGYGAEVGAAAIVFPRAKRYWISVDAGRDIFTNERLAGRYVLHSWVNDVYPPAVRLLTRRVSAGRPLLVARIVDFPARGGQSGVDPSSIVIAYQRRSWGRPPTTRAPASSSSAFRSRHRPSSRTRSRGRSRPPTSRRRRTSRPRAGRFSRTRRSARSRFAASRVPPRRGSHPRRTPAPRDAGRSSSSSHRRRPAFAAWSSSPTASGSRRDAERLPRSTRPSGRPGALGRASTG